MLVAARNSSCKFSGIVTLLCRYSSSSPSPARAWRANNNKLGYGGGYMTNIGQGGFIIRAFSDAGSRGGINRPEDHDTGKSHFNYTMVKDVQPASPPKPGISSRAKWFMGIVLSMFLHLTQKWESLRQLEGKVEMVVDEVEVVAEVVEKAAAAAENVSAKVADQFPNNSRIKEAAVAVEYISSAAVADAQLAQNFVHKVEDVKKDLKDLETMVEPLVDNITNSELKPHHK